MNVSSAIVHSISRRTVAVLASHAGLAGIGIQRQADGSRFVVTADEAPGAGGKIRRDRTACRFRATGCGVAGR